MQGFCLARSTRSLKTDGTLQNGPGLVRWPGLGIWKECPKHFLRSEKSGPSVPDTVRMPGDKIDTMRFSKKVLCSSCRLIVTFSESEIPVNGKSRYTFFNPHGLVFDITCYGMAEGCACKGKPVREFSWFPGFFWQVAHCRRCKKHLGWMFSKPGSLNEQEHIFFGLIKRELVEDLSQEN